MNTNNLFICFGVQKLKKYIQSTRGNTYIFYQVITGDKIHTPFLLNTNGQMRFSPTELQGISKAHIPKMI